MLTLLSHSFVPITLLLVAMVVADVKPFITTEAEFFTECKTCPRSLCTNKETVGSSWAPFNVTCYTHGTKIMGDDLWLKTGLGCYVTQYDVLEYEGDCMSKLLRQ